MTPRVGESAESLGLFLLIDRERHSLGHLHKLQTLHIRPRDVRGLRPVPPEHHRHAPLRIVAGGIVVAADLLARRHIERIVESKRGQPSILRDPKAV